MSVRFTVFSTLRHRDELLCRRDFSACDMRRTAFTVATLRPPCNTTDCFHRHDRESKDGNTIKILTGAQQARRSEGRVKTTQRSFPKFSNRDDPRTQNLTRGVRREHTSFLPSPNFTNETYDDDDKRRRGKEGKKNEKDHF